MNKTILLILVLLLSRSANVFGSTELDKLYAMRNIIGVVVDPDREPINGEGVENELVKVLRSESRFTFDDEAYLQFKDIIKGNDSPEFKRSLGRDRLKQLYPQVRQISNTGVEAVVFAEVVPAEDGKYRIGLTFVNASNTEVIASKEVLVDDPLLLPNFAAATKQGLADLFKALPFDGTLVSREGYRVVIDRGRNEFKPGMEVPVFTIETDKKTLRPLLEETGLILITQAEENLSFGRILVDKKPREIVLGNKIILPSRPNYRSLAGFVEEKTVQQNPVRDYGFMEARFGFSQLSMVQTPQDGTAAQSNSVFYPTLDLAGQIWLTANYFLEGDMTAAIWSIDSVQGSTPHDLSTAIGDFRFLAGYRWLLFGSLYRPTVTFKLGYGRHEFIIDTPNQGYEFDNDTYTGASLGVGVSVPFTEKFTLDLDLAAFLFAGFSESPVTSGANITGTSLWDIGVKASYLLIPACNLDVRMRFLSAGAGFSGQGTRPDALASISESVISFTAGASYFF